MVFQYRRFQRMAAAGIVLLVMGAASAASAGHITGEARKDDWTIRAGISVDASGAAAGRLTLLRHLRGKKSLSCEYRSFGRVMILVNQARFDATGACQGTDPSGLLSTAISSHFIIIDNGVTGRAVDRIEVTTPGTAGVSLSGPIDRGNLRVRPVKTPSLDKLQLTAMKRLRRKSRTNTEFRLEGGFPRGVLARIPVPPGAAAEQARNFLHDYRDLYRLNLPDLRLGVRRVFAAPSFPGQTVTLYQTFKGVPVHGAEIAVFLRDNTVYGTVGALLTSAIRVDTTPEITPAQAEDIARAHAGVPGAWTAGQTLLMVFDAGVAGVAGRTPGSHLAWRVTLGQQGERLFVDAHDGMVLSQTSLQKTFYQLYLQTANNLVNASDTDCYWGTDEDDQIGDEDEVDADYQSDPDAVNAFNFAKSTYDFYMNTFGRDSYDNSIPTGNELEVVIHALIKDKNGVVEPNAQYKTCGNGDELFEFSDGWMRADVMTHEFTHGVVDYGSELDSGNLPGSLNESLADIFAFFHTNDPIIGEGLPDKPPLGIRSLADPSADPYFDPDRWSERLKDSADNGRVHANAGITNKAAWLMARGGTHPDTNITVSAMGDGFTRNMFYWTMLTMPSNADQFAMRDTVLLNAAMHNYDSDTLDRIKNVFLAVEVGVEPGDVDGDVAPDATDNCQFVPNPGQEDSDNDDIGNACDGDIDGDGVPELDNCYTLECLLATDNCPGVYNPGQEDMNGNNIGAACDPEEDGDMDDDEVPDDEDNCPLDYNPKVFAFGYRAIGAATQPDVDHDGEGDACDPDSDGDTVTDSSDNCVSTPNTDQADSDGDLLGDACDTCPGDADSNVAWGYFKDPVSGDVTNMHPVVPDSDGDGIPDACDTGGGRGSRLSIQVDGGRFRPEQLQPDGRSRQLRITAQAGEMLSVPLPICLGECPQAPAVDSCVALEFEGLSNQVLATVTDDRGRGVGAARPPKLRARLDQPRVLRAQPRGGRLYHLNFVFSPRFEGETEFMLKMTPCSVGDPGGERPIIRIDGGLPASSGV